MSAPEMTRMVKRKPLPAEPVEVIATESERAALARRFGISAVERFIARVDLAEDGSAVTAEGVLEADLIQPCAISGEDFPVSVRDTVVLRFVQSRGGPVEPDAEIELADEELDEIEYDGEMFDLGEALAQSLALAIDPYAEGPNADAARKVAGIVLEGEQDGPLAALLAGLQKN